MATKENVINYTSKLTTIGSELEGIFVSKNIHNADKVLSIKNLHSKEVLTDNQIDRVCRFLGDNNDELRHFIIKFQSNYFAEKQKCKEVFLKSKRNFSKLKIVLPLLYGEFNDGEDRLDDILDYFGVDSEQEIFDESEKTAALFRKQNNIKVDSINLKAWLRRGELDFYNLTLPQYDEPGFKKWIDLREWQNNIADSEYFKSLPNILREFGIALSLVPYLPNTVYGAVRWIDGNPLVEISDRNRDLASCWFTLFHEFGHVICHKNEEIFEGEINSGHNATGQMERDANKFANSYLFNGDDLRKEVFNNKRRGIDMTVSGLSEKYNVNPLFVSYWLRKAQYQPWFQKSVAIDFLPN